MDTHNVVVTYNATPEEKALFLDSLGDRASLFFLSETSPDRRSSLLADATILLSWNFPQEILAQDYSNLRNVSLIQLVTAGADHVPFADLPVAIKVASNPGAYATPMAEHVMAMVLALTKRLFVEQQKLRQGEFDDHTLNRSLAGATAGIIGFGGTGRATARIMRAFGMNIFAINQSGESSEVTDFIGTLQDKRRLLEACDVVVLALPLTKATRGLIGKEELAWMKQDAILVNVARGAIIDEEALYTHARKNPTFGVGIDTWWQEPLSGAPFHMNYPFLDLPNVIGSPHNSALVASVIGSAAHEAATNIARFLNGEGVMGMIQREDYV